MKYQVSFIYFKRLDIAFKRKCDFKMKIAHSKFFVVSLTKALFVNFSSSGDVT